jgi:hypothetical protein
MNERYAVWAYHKEIGTFCEDARLGEQDAATDSPAGQAGWDVAVGFTGAADLGTRLQIGLPLPAAPCTWKFTWFIPTGRDCPMILPGQIARLAVMAHGDRPGQIYLNGKPPDLTKSPPPEKAPLTPETFKDFEAALDTIGKATALDAEVLFMSCIAGRGERGAELLIMLSRLWPGRRVVGFTTIGYKHAGKMKRPSESCQEVGMRETEAANELMMHSRKYSPTNMDILWQDLTKFPWASAASRFAKVALNGQIIQAPKYPDDDPPPVPAAAPPKKKAGLPGRRK